LGVFGKQDLNDFRGGCRVTVKLPPVRVGKTSSQHSHKGSVLWQESIRVYSAHEVPDLIFHTKGHGYKGYARILASEILEKRHIDGWFDVDGNFRNHGKLHIVVNFLPADEDPLWGAGVGNAMSFQGVSNTFFPMRKGCKVTPYQNSHVEDDFLPPIVLDGGKQYRPGRYWQELHHYILEAKKFVYIAGAAYVPLPFS
jgi:phospholipase D1/2